ncbi:MAG: hypothetical protein HZT41_14005 [Dechloromonas sp.]|nr:MAG: hypothetical protein HZT41_14005 [Dechloromonas sp.]
MAGFSWLAGSLPALSMEKIENSSAFVPVFPLLLPFVNREIPEIPPNRPPHPARPATVSCLNAVRGRRNCQFPAGFSGRPRQFGLFFNEEIAGNVRKPFGVNLQPCEE